MPLRLSDLDFIAQSPGVYLMINRYKQILYIGKANNLKKRLKSYFSSERSRVMVPFLMKQTETVETIVTFSEKEALLLENNLIKRHQPKYNVLLKDDKTFISLVINEKHRWPMIRLVRCKKRTDSCFGPYTSAYAARQIVDLMHQIFKLRQCSDRELASRIRPCLLYDIKRCLAPCVGKCTKSAYDAEVKRAIAFLNGSDRDLIQQLKKERKEASSDLDFEKAARIHRTIAQIEQITDRQYPVVESKVEESDVFALYSEGNNHVIAKLLFRKGKLIGAKPFLFQTPFPFDEGMWENFLLQHYPKDQELPSEILLPLLLKKGDLLKEIFFEQGQGKVKLVYPRVGQKAYLLKLAMKNAKTFFQRGDQNKSSLEKVLLDLEETCELTRCPLKIECFDSSNLSQTDLVACMVGFTNGERDKKKTRLFKIKNRLVSDDCSSLREVLLRHLERSKEQDALPDLILVDGGRGQLNVVLEVFKRLKIACVDVIALAKERGRHDKGLNVEKVFIPYREKPVQISPRSPVLFMLQKIRDEAHRVAITFHRNRREKRMIKSLLSEIPGIGSTKEARLLKTFKSVEKIREATDKQLKEVPGITQKDILTLRTFFDAPN